ncbi:MAG: isoamylase early set domain-containing protein [Chloroflexota bacterium]|nr:isoamylase early set domain-containing protein [Chloroflexota bacterium]
MIIKKEGKEPGTMLVIFRLHKSVMADSVYVVGDFNNWNRHSHPMKRSEDDEMWELSLELEKGNTYQFRYLIDGNNWQNDWHADRYVPNPFGGENSVIET